MFKQLEHSALGADNGSKPCNFKVQRSEIKDQDFNGESRTFKADVNPLLSLVLLEMVERGTAYGPLLRTSGCCSEVYYLHQEETYG